jgi:hypothetical protein
LTESGILKRRDTDAGRPLGNWLGREPNRQRDATAGQGRPRTGGAAHQDVKSATPGHVDGSQLVDSQAERYRTSRSKHA